MDNNSNLNPQVPSSQPQFGSVNPSVQNQTEPQNLFVSSGMDVPPPPPPTLTSNPNLGVSEFQQPHPVVSQPTEAQQVFTNTTYPALSNENISGTVPPPPPPTMDNPNNVSVPNEVNEGGKKNNSKKIIAIIGGILVLILLIVLGVIFIPRLMSNNQEPKEVSLTWWGLWEDQTIIAPIINQYQTEHPNVKISYVKQSPQDYRERLNNALAKGTGPDIYTFHNSWLPMFQSELDVVPASVMTVDDFNKNYYPVMADDLERGANLYGLPTGYDGIALYVNEELLQSSGKEIPKTWDELRETALSLTIKDENGVIKQSGVSLGRTENVDHWQEILGLMMLQNGVKMTEPDKCYGVASGQNCPGSDALSYFSLFSAVDGVWDETLPNSTVAFAGGKVAMYFGPSWRAFEIKQQSPGLKFKIVPVPQLPKSTPSDPDTNYATYWVSGVWKRSKERKTAWEFMKYLNSKETLQELYTNASKVREFGQPYPRVDMASLLQSDPNTSTFVYQAPTAKSWYLQSRTFDGPTGINSQIDKYFEDAVNALNAGTQADSALKTVTQGVNQVLSNYGLATTTQAVSP